MKLSRSAMAGFLSGALLGCVLVPLLSGPVSCTKAKSQEEVNMERMLRFSEAYNKKDFKAFDDLIPAGQVLHINGVTMTSHADSFKAVMRKDLETYTDCQSLGGGMFASGNMVASWGTWKGIKHKQTGEDWEFNMISISRFENGKAVEYWSNSDELREFLKHGYTLVPPAPLKK